MRRITDNEVPGCAPHLRFGTSRSSSPNDLSMHMVKGACIEFVVPFRVVDGGAWVPWPQTGQTHEKCESQGVGLIVGYGATKRRRLCGKR